MEELIDAILASDVDHVTMHSIMGEEFTLFTVEMKNGERKFIRISGEVFRTRKIVKEIEDLGVKVHCLILD